MNFYFTDLDCEVDLIDNPTSFPQPVSIKQEKICQISSNSNEDAKIKDEKSSNEEKVQKDQLDENVENASR